MRSFENDLNLGEVINFDKNNKPIPEVEIIKENENYVVFNVKTPEKKFTFATKEELYMGIGSPARRPHQFSDLTGEDLFFGR